LRSPAITVVDHSGEATEVHVANRDRRATLADRLNMLFEALHRAGESPPSNEEVARAITEAGTPISGTYIWQLRKGLRTNPTVRHLEALGRYFGVGPTYFIDDDYAARVDADLTRLILLRDLGVERVALRMVGLSKEAQEAISRTVEQARRQEGLDGNSSRLRSAGEENP
jgi:transcriptional regulator with XRE-family HTH domain